jgi:hypothetical protein
MREHLMTPGIRPDGPPNRTPDEPPPRPVDDDEEDGDIATPKRDRDDEAEIPESRDPGSE